MLQIGMHGLALVLTVITGAALKKGGKTLPPPAGLAIGIALGIAYVKAGDPWAILSEQAGLLTGRIGDEFGTVPAAIALALLGAWHYLRPGLLVSTLMGFLAVTAASAASELWLKLVSIVDSLLTVIAG
ncbi:hypothetical protein [Streptomyces sp. DH37]|uniref:hypothetical protein n=1 Tax=Streptomyces sp. DH37 TaxID=3040122 RepID=UPI002441176F|nr:hypothetical protein [Streptomyces sp. DH37]MDG9703776.1 hypothetical protein [Streptomyces sp. DH37]